MSVFFVSSASPSRLKAKKDIVCYKFLIRANESHLISPYYYFKYIIGKRYFIDWFFSFFTFIKKPYPNHPLFFVGKGFHSYINQHRCAQEVQPYIDFAGENNIGVFKCIIPKGSYYYYNPPLKTFVSSSIKVVEQV